MERRIINPWTWQDQMGYVQANKVTGAQRTLYLAGQTSARESRNTQPLGLRFRVPLTEGSLEIELARAYLSACSCPRSS